MGDESNTVAIDTVLMSDFEKELKSLEREFGKVCERKLKVNLGKVMYCNRNLLD